MTSNDIPQTVMFRKKEYTLANVVDKLRIAKEEVEEARNSGCKAFVRPFGNRVYCVYARA